jgi:GxxExxY protein
MRTGRLQRIEDSTDSRLREITVMTELLHAELSYAVRGVMFHVYNSLGPLLKEKFYEQAIAIGLEKRGIRCATQKSFDVFYEAQQVGLYFVDVWVEDGKLLLELKVAPEIQPLHRAQAISYLKVTNADLAFVANFGGASVHIERFPNFVRDRQAVFEWQSEPAPAQWLHPELTDAILCGCHRVHFTLGPGFLHQVYRRAVMIELRRSGLNFTYLKELPVNYEGELLGQQEARLIIVENKVVLAVYALSMPDETLTERLKARLRQLTIPFGLLVNFHDSRLAVAPVRIK